MMKRIAIFCDGTWMRADCPCPTNVARLAQVVSPADAGGMEQVVAYLDGVGTGQGTGALARGIDRVMGGLFGHGLMGTLAAAYRFLVYNYAPGDQIYVFGFSRGAFTARSLAGLVRNSGIVRRSQAAAIGGALRLYHARGSEAHPRSPAAREFRTRFTNGRDAPEIRYLGVFDTVGSLGVPAHLWIAQALNRGYRFHDTTLSAHVRAARHAVAIDERRRVFPPALWDNLEALNVGRRGVPYRQTWFPGDHTSVGGGGAVTALSSDAALWIAEGAASEGLTLDAAALEAMAVEVDCLGALEGRARSLIGGLLAWDSADRPGPAILRDLAPAAVRRWQADEGYRPAALGRVRGALDGPWGLQTSG